MPEVWPPAAEGAACKHTLRILAADVGGTHCRLARFKAEVLCPAEPAAALPCLPQPLFECLILERTARLKTANIADTRAFLAAFAQTLETTPHTADILAVAAAGPVRDNLRAELTNGSLQLDFTEHLRGHKPRFLLLNDCTAQAWFCVSEAGKEARQIFGPVIAGTQHAPLVVGAGTGLGTAALLTNKGGGFTALPSEAGHAAFAFQGEEEQAFHAFLRTQLDRPYASCEDVLCGSGLILLHEYCSGHCLPPEKIEAAALQENSPTLRMFTRFYGRFCRDRALATLCDGLWIVGGIAGRNPQCVTSEHFLREFYTSPRCEAFLRNIPIYLTENTDSGLWGAAKAGLAAFFAEKTTLQCAPVQR